MQPTIDRTRFGSITIEGQRYTYDILIRLDGTIHKRKKKLSKQLYGTSHIVSQAEAEHIHEDDMEHLILGSGQFDRVRLSDEARQFFEERAITVSILGTPDAIKLWNRESGKIVGLFHLTC